MKFRLALVIASTLVSASAHRTPAADTQPATPASAPAVKSLFDPARHMRISEVKSGMKGYGLSVFRGTKIERFDVEVVDVLHNFNPKGDVILIRATGMNLEHTGSVAGMSGSPIFLKDDQGRERMIGAFAYGWPLTKDPLAGVQPIEYMLKVPADTIAPPAAAPANDAAKGEGAPGAVRPLAGTFHWSLAESPYFPKLNFDNVRRNAELTSRRPAGRAGLDAGTPQLQPLATPLMAAGLSPEMLAQIGPLFEMMGLVPLQAGGGGSAPAGEVPAKIEPGSVLAVPMILGDSNMTAIGTVTEVIGDRVFGFGHPFNNEGPISLPMGSGRISQIIPNLVTSFKLGSMTAPAGQLNSDEQVAVAGQLGASPTLVPIDLTVNYADGTPQRKYHFDGALHPRLTPLICGVSLMSALTGAHDLPPFNTVDYQIKLEFTNGEVIDINNRSVNTNPMDIFSEIGMPLMLAADNPFERVLVKKMSGTFNVSAIANAAQIVEVNIPKTRFRPGETIRAFVTYKPFRGEEAIEPAELTLPADLPEGNYQLVVSDWRRYLGDEQQSRPFRFTAERVTEMFDVLRDFTQVRHNALYLRLVRHPDGVAVGRTAMPQLPSSRRTVIMGAGRSNTTRFVSSTVKIVPLGYVMEGASEFTITIDPKAKVGVGKPGPVKVDAPNAAPPAVPARTEPAPIPANDNK